jgi:menaquinone-dependent protoporphyrinogen IX oxidase
MKVLIAYSTRHGYAAKAAFAIGEGLLASGFLEVKVVDADKVKANDLLGSDAFVIGSSVATGAWRRPALEILRKAAPLGKPIALFVSAGAMMAASADNQRWKEEVFSLYIEPPVLATGAKLLSWGVFGGEEYRCGKVLFSNWEEEEATAWAGEVAASLGRPGLRCQ